MGITLPKWEKQPPRISLYFGRNNRTWRNECVVEKQPILAETTVHGVMSVWWKMGKRMENGKTGACKNGCVQTRVRGKTGAWDNGCVGKRVHGKTCAWENGCCPTACSDLGSALLVAPSALPKEPLTKTSKERCHCFHDKCLRMLWPTSCPSQRTQSTVP